MIGLVVASEGRLALEFVAALHRVLGPVPQLETLVIESDQPTERDRQRLIDAIARVDSGDGVVVLTEEMGGIASNFAIEMMNRINIEVLAGINLRALVKLVTARDMPLRSAVAAARDSGRRHLSSSLGLRGE